MAFEVQHAYWHFWQPGSNQDNSPSEPGYAAYLKKASKRNSEQRLLLLAIALDAMPLYPNGTEDAERAIAYVSQEVLAERIQRSPRTVHRILLEMAKWGDVEMEQCDGFCRAGGRVRHGGTNHIYLAHPVGADPWRYPRSSGRYVKRKTKKEADKAKSPRRRK